ncbi:hypothetical protein [Methanococcoides sp. NM1]|uniref:hypothetical protein n=1 Tax=Methanococcoides sp. NM1 TaxID=1201013 RepID=UPI001082408F|nr:hypothetical protein [Methanococcoides sp. NM1]
MGLSLFDIASMIVVTVIMVLTVGYIIAPAIHNIGFVLLFVDTAAAIFFAYLQYNQLALICATMALLGLVLMVGASSYISTVESNPVAKVFIDAGTKLANSTEGLIP